MIRRTIPTCHETDLKRRVGFFQRSAEGILYFVAFLFIIIAMTLLSANG